MSTVRTNGLRNVSSGYSGQQNCLLRNGKFCEVCKQRTTLLLYDSCGLMEMNGCFPSGMQTELVLEFVWFPSVGPTVYNLQWKFYPNICFYSEQIAVEHMYFVQITAVTTVDETYKNTVTVNCAHLVGRKETALNTWRDDRKPQPVSFRRTILRTCSNLSNYNFCIMKCKVLSVGTQRSNEFRIYDCNVRVSVPYSNAVQVRRDCMYMAVHIHLSSYIT